MKRTLYLLCTCCILQTAIHAQTDWHITGNSGTNPPTNYLGTSDNKALVFKTNNLERMRISSTGQVAIGTSTPAQRLDVHGNINIGSGFALYMENHPILRVDSLNGNTYLGSGIVINGLASSINHNNTASGFQALSNSIGGYNTANGYQALNSNHGSLNTANGAQALHVNAGYSNTASGYAALYNNNGGAYNTASGVEALYSNTNGYFNVADGNAALINNLYGSNNTASGYAALYNNTTGNYNVAVGYLALEQNYNSENNAAIGSLAGASPHGWNNTFIGSGTDVTSPDIYNGTALGNNVLITSSNQVRIGNNFVTSIGGFANWSNISDGRVKRNIKENVPGLAFINKLKPITYNLDMDAADNIMQRIQIKDKNGKLLQPKASDAEISARNAKQQVVYTGFVAQDVEKVAKDLNYNFSGVDAAKSSKDLYGLRYSEFVVPLVKAVQELSKMNDDKDHVINDLKTRLERLETAMNMQSSQAGNQGKAISINDASLEQNRPNPFTIYSASHQDIIVIASVSIIVLTSHYNLDKDCLFKIENYLFRSLVRFKRIKKPGVTYFINDILKTYFI